jgi:hypothetical protein
MLAAMTSEVVALPRAQARAGAPRSESAWGRRGALGLLAAGLAVALPPAAEAQLRPTFPGSHGDSALERSHPGWPCFQTLQCALGEHDHDERGTAVGAGKVAGWRGWEGHREATPNCCTERDAAVPGERAHVSRGVVAGVALGAAGATVGYLIGRYGLDSGEAGMAIAAAGESLLLPLGVQWGLGTRSDGYPQAAALSVGIAAIASLVVLSTQTDRALWLGAVAVPLIQLPLTVGILSR